MTLQKLFQLSSSSPPPMYCTNPACPQPRNNIGSPKCEACQSPLTYRYLWAVGSDASQIQAGQLVGNRYYVVGPQVWLDTKPGTPPLLPDQRSETILSYLYLYPYQLHLPNLYGIYAFGAPPDMTDILLLENVPIDRRGGLFPALVEAWPSATAVRQVYWLWQLLELWTPLAERGATYSLLVKDNLRVENWRVRLLQVYQGKVQPTLQDLADTWSVLVETAVPAVQYRLQNIDQQLRHGDGQLEGIKSQLNQLLLEQAAQLPLHLGVAGETDTGPARLQNEDSCYPLQQDVQHTDIYPNDKLIPRVSFVCDGVGGHEGGEVASQLAVQSLKPLIHSFLSEIMFQEELTPPEVMIEQLEEITRVVNNVIAAQNNLQGKALRQRMGTTLVMAIQLPQNVKLPDGSVLSNSHELYLVNVGDSRAYWLTQEACLQLTVDDDVATRDVKAGRCLLWDARQRRGSSALTQALGTREAEFLQPTVQRFIIEEDGLLLLCSDGFSDQDWVEKTWETYAPAVLRGELSLEAAVKTCIEIANTKNGHDNVSVLLTYFGVSPHKLLLMEPAQPPIPEPLPTEPTEASKALMYDESVPESSQAAALNQRQKLKQILLSIGLVVLLIAGGIGVWLFVRSHINSSPNNPVEDSEIQG